MVTGLSHRCTLSRTVAHLQKNPQKQTNPNLLPLLLRGEGRGEENRLFAFFAPFCEIPATNAYERPRTTRRTRTRPDAQRHKIHVRFVSIRGCSLPCQNESERERTGNETRLPRNAHERLRPTKSNPGAHGHISASQTPSPIRAGIFHLPQ